MVPYYILVFAPFLCSLIMKQNNYEENKVARKVTMSVFFLIFLLLLAFRDEMCGQDMLNYKNFFANAQYTSWGVELKPMDEPGYFYLQKLFHEVSSSFHAFTAFVAFASILPWWVLYSKESDNTVLTIAVFLAVAPFSMFFSGLRQILAMAFVVPAWNCAKKKKWIGFVLCVLVAFTMHSSAWIIAALLPLYYLKITKKWLIPLGGVMAGVLVLSRPIMEFVVSIMGEQYVLGMTDTNAYTILILLLLFAAYTFFIPDESKMDRDTVAMRNILVFTILIQCFAPVHTLAMRMNYYFLPFIPLLISRVSHRARYALEQVATIANIVMIVFFTFWFFRTLTLNDNLNIVPYTTWLF